MKVNKIVERESPHKDAEIDISALSYKGEAQYITEAMTR